MNRRRNPDRSARLSPGRMLAATALIAVVFSVGLIVGQHLLFEDSLPPMVSTSGEASAANLPATTENTASDDTGELNLFSFYDVLATTEINDDHRTESQRVFHTDPSDDADPPSDTATDTVDRAFGIDDDQAPNTDDGSIPARYTLQIASHPTMEQARTEMDRLRAIELDPHVVAANVAGHGKYYRVRVGKFQNEDQARAFQARIEAAHSLRTIITPL